jgi:hypothetical protein
VYVRAAGARRLEPGAADDRGAERLVRQTRFLAAAFASSSAAAEAAPTSMLRARLVASPAPRPYRHVVVAVGDRSSDRYGLWPADWDLLARLPALTALDVVVTDTALAGDLHERLHHLLPGLDEVREGDASDASSPVLRVPADGAQVHVARDREEEVAGFARRVKAAVRCGALDRLDRAALVVRTPLPYVYVTREVLRSAGVLPDVRRAPARRRTGRPPSTRLLGCRHRLRLGPAIALPGSPHFRFEDGGERRARPGTRSTARSPSSYLGQLSALRPLVEAWTARSASSSTAARRRAGRVLERLASALEPLRTPSPVAERSRLLVAFITGRGRARARTIRCARGCARAPPSSAPDRAARRLRPVRRDPGGVRRHGRRLPALD